MASDRSVSDGTVGTLATRYSEIKADSLGETADAAKGCSILGSGGQITAYETFQVM